MPKSAPKTPIVDHRVRVMLGVLLALFAPWAFSAQEELTAQIPSSKTGAALYVAHCASCHTGTEKTAGPHVSALRRMSPGQLRFALERGKMRTHAEPLGHAGREAILSFLSVAPHAAVYEVTPRARCTDHPAPAAAQIKLRKGALVDTADQWISWGINPQNTRQQSDTQITSANVSRLTLAWSFGLPNTTEARSQPVITANSVFVAAASGHVFALDRTTGCVKWHFRSDTLLRSALTLGVVKNQPALFVGSFDAQLFALSATDGRLLWRRDLALFDASTITGATSQSANRLFVPISAFGVALAQDPGYECCKSHGAVRALNADTGDVLWTTRMAPPARPTHLNSAGTQMWGPSGVPIWSAPTVDAKRQRLYVGTGENTSSPATGRSDSIVALDMRDGQILWTYQATQDDAFNMACGSRKGPSCPKEEGPDFDFGAAPMLVVRSHGPDLLIAGQKSGAVHALEAATGKLIWRRRIGQGSPLGGVHWGLALAADRVIVPIADPPFPRPGYSPQPGVYALSLTTGEPLWEYRAQQTCTADIRQWFQRAEAWPDCSPLVGFSAAPTTTQDLVFAGSLDGVAHAFSLEDGQPKWRYDSVRAFDTVNGVSAHGGSIDNAGIQVTQDMVFLQSGYSLFNQMPGNVLLAFRLADNAVDRPSKATER